MGEKASSAVAKSHSAHVRQLSESALPWVVAGGCRTVAIGLPYRAALYASLVYSARR